MRAMLNNFAVKPNCDLIRLSRFVRGNSCPEPRLYTDIVGLLMNDTNLQEISLPTRWTKKLARMWDGFKGDKSLVPYYWDIQKGGGTVLSASEGATFFGQVGRMKITRDVCELWRLYDHIIGAVSSCFYFKDMQFQVPYELHSLPNLNAYRTSIDVVANGNTYIDLTCSATDDNLLSKMIELLMLCGTTDKVLMVYNFYSGKGYRYIPHEPNYSLLASVQELYKKFCELRNKQEVENKI